MREAEETVLHHLNYCTMYLLSEQHVVIMFRVFERQKCIPLHIL